MSNPKSVLDTYEVNPKKSLGQNFMHDPNALDKIVATANLIPTDTVVEVGPGTGALTEKLSQVARHVFAIEVDDRLQPILEDRFNSVNNVYFVFNDILKTNVVNLVGNNEFVVVANVPYYISSAIIWHFLEPEKRPKRMVITMQYEVAERIMAQPGDMSLLTVAVQFYGKPTIVSKLSPAVFWPRPNITSAVVRIDTHPTPPVDVPSSTAFFRVVKAGFSMKRKQLKNSISGGLQVKSNLASQFLESAGIDPQRRAETLSLEEWGQLTRAIAAQGAV